jgi:branched-chain amino acid transport system ATP-binding protein
MLAVNGLTVSYGSIVAARGIDVTVERGEIVGIIGPNGAGKTSTLNAVAGLLSPAAGEVFLDGIDISGRPPDDILRLGLCLVPEHRRLFASLTVADNLRVGGVTASAQERAERLEEVSERFPVLRRKWAELAGHLSGGEAQQLAIARALMSDPRMLLMDEPALGLAPVLVDVVYQLIDDLRAKGRTLLVVEQSATRLLEVVDRAYVMRTGEIAASGTGAELIDQADLFAHYVGRS